VPGYPRPRKVRPTLVGELGGGSEGVAVTGVTHSSSAVQPGDLYAALPGARVHGAQFIAEALQRGAVAVLTDPAGVRPDAGVPFIVVDRPRDVLGDIASKIYGDPTSRLTTIGITGTAGKTSTTYLIEAGLRAAGQVTGLIGTVETRLGDLTVPSIRTTPEATDLHALFAAALERGVQSVAMEVSSHALEVGRVGGVHFAAAGYTNFGLDHLDFHPSVEAYFAAKARLFDGRAAVEILNFDDVSVMRLRKPASWTYSVVGEDPPPGAAADFGVSGVTVDDSPGGYGQHFDVHWRGRTVRSGVRLPGRHNVANALLAIASLVAVGVDLDVAAGAVAAAPGSPGRMERVEAPGDVVGVVDYAHKPDAMVEVLKALRTLAAARGGRVICVVGAGGDRDRGKRPLMGRAAAEGADLVIVTDDNPRTEDPAAIRAGVLAGAAGGPADVVEIDGRRAAIAHAVAHAKPGDVVALLGKGHETGQEVLGEVLPFDDRVELATALTETAS
jgi:UDP-N-acetylmuramoyl-L-alanyl-D-glutamate--2,6-diaminopimelate ligase